MQYIQFKKIPRETAKKQRSTPFLKPFIKQFPNNLKQNCDDTSSRSLSETPAYEKTR